MNEHYENGMVVSSSPLTTEQLDEINAAKKASRSLAYAAESDPIFFKWQRGEATQQEWLDKIAEIKARN